MMRPLYRTPHRKRKMLTLIDLIERSRKLSRGVLMMARQEILSESRCWGLRPDAAELVREVEEFVATPKRTRRTPSHHLLTDEID